MYADTGYGAAESALRAVMRQRLGRIPTDAEVKKFVAALNKQQMADPTKVTSTTTTSGNSTTTVSHTQSPDVDLTREAEKFSDKEPRTGEQQGYMMGQYLTQLMGMAGAGSGLNG